MMMMMMMMMMMTNNWSQVMKQREHLEELAADEVIIFNFLFNAVKERKGLGRGKCTLKAYVYVG